jgi:hypothetical protein
MPELAGSSTLLRLGAFTKEEFGLFMKHLSSLEPSIGEHFGECYLGRLLTSFF